MVNDWENPALQGRGRLPAHADLIPQAGLEAALRGPRAASPFLRTLNGGWRFRLYRNPHDAPAAAADPGYDDSGWDEITVPGNWQLQGYDTPYYTDNQLPFGPDDLPRVPADDNPTGVYRCRFDRPPGWETRRILLTFHGVDSAFHAWLNGAAVGFSKDSRLPAEFDITNLVQAQENVLVVRVYRWSDGSYLENQDMWRLSGVFRDVELWSPAGVHVSDVQVQTTLPGGGGADLHVAASVLNSTAADCPDVRLSVRLFDREGGEAVAPVCTRLAVAAHTQETAAWTVPIPAARLWSAESPYLYTVVIETQAGIEAGSAPAEYVRQRVGLREVSIREAQLRINARPITIAGVNRHEHDPVTGHTVSEASMRADILLMKQFNINAVRTSHYPNHPLWYDLCDEYGLYVLDEANLECDGALERLAGDRAWEGAFLSRVQRMVERDRNHPCIIAWSLGNESGLGCNHHAAAAWLREADPARPIHYHPAGDDPITDIVAPMYPSIERLEAVAQQLDAQADGRPVIMCEYAHSMGNATGNLAEYWQIVRRYARVQGGFVWDWVDQGFLRQDAAGRTWWAYGGDFGDAPNDGNFCLNGLVGADRKPHPALSELRKLAEPFAAEAVDVAAGCIRVTNRRHTLSTGDLLLCWQVEAEGAVIQQGSTPLPELWPGESAEIQLPLPASCPPAAGERWLTVRFTLREPTVYAPAGHIVAWEQFALPPATSAQAQGVPPAVVQWEEVAHDAARLRLWSAAVQIAFDVRAGRLIEYRLGGENLLVEPPSLNLWRAPTDNDEGLWGADKMAIQWRDAGLDRLERTVESVDILASMPGETQICVVERWRPQATGAPLRSGWWDFMLLMLRMHFFQFWTPAALAGLAEQLGLALPAAAAPPTKYGAVAALVAAADASGQMADLLRAAHVALQAAPNPHALASFERRMARFLHQDEQELAAAFALAYAGGFHCTTLHRLHPSGVVDLEVSVQPFGPLPLLPRLGVRLALAGACNHVTWFGRGPHENYPDRKTGAALGRYTGTVAEQFVAYGRPQENGNKCDVRWVTFTDAAGRGLHVAGDAPLHFSAHHYTAADLAAASHLHKLHERPHVYCTFDAAMSGLGNESCGPGVLPAYQIEPAPRCFRLRLRPA